MGRRINPALVVSVVALVMATTGVAAATLPADATMTDAVQQSIPSLAAGSIATRDVAVANDVAANPNITPLVGIAGTGGRLAYSYEIVASADPNSEIVRVTYRNVSGGTSPAGTATVQVLTRAQD